ncbi:hypothetical protein TEU_03415 [Thermococcus eurythermalis]|uniref:Uncharacterized protein n=1 Tax=Thermococcus eurythermalis TaxID=1505907 RepID=A0A097QSJ6_9EURY|nr:hypothetical protein [Thermococcus eurythermalis]AIU69470.1 hypothetical protein TEU_03415 [Thermococcus eurythermalis]
MKGKVHNQDDVVVEMIAQTKFKIIIPERTVSIINGAGYFSVKKKHITSLIELKKKDKIKTEMIIAGQKIKFLSKMYNYKQYNINYQIPTIIVDMLRTEFGFSGFRFTVNITIIVDVEKNTQKLILEVPQWEIERCFDLKKFEEEMIGGEAE